MNNNIQPPTCKKINIPSFSQKSGIIDLESEINNYKSDFLFPNSVEYLFVSRWVEFIPCFDPRDHGIGQLEEVVVHLSKLCPDLLGELDVAFLHGGAVLGKSGGLEKRDQLLLPVDAFVFFLQVHKWVARFTVPDVGQTRLHSQSQVIAYHLKHQ